MNTGNGYNEIGTYDYNYGAYTYLNTYYMREETLADLTNP
jgi:hypothetical protein